MCRSRRQVGSIVQYACDAGHRLQGGDEVRRCQPDLSLSGAEPSCRPVSCPSPDPPTHGRVSLSRPTLVAGSSATYTCLPGHALVAGEALRTCRVDGTLSGAAPSCRPVECDKPAEVISNGRMVGTDFTFNHTITYLCDEGYGREEGGYWGSINDLMCL